MTTVRKHSLSDLEIDEVSTVDRPANQYGLITFSKDSGGGAGIQQEVPMSLMTEEVVEVFDADGAPVGLDDLQDGDVVYDGQGVELVWVDSPEEVVDGGEVGKGMFGAAEEGLASLKGAGAKFRDTHTSREFAAGAKGTTSKRRLNARGKALAGAGAGGAALGAGAASMSKSAPSLGDQVLVELSKAVTEGDRNKIISKAMQQVEIVKSENAALAKALTDERDIRLEAEFISKADDYNLPVDSDEFGPVLKRLVENMSAEDLDVLDNIFKAAGEMLYNEVGFVGAGDNNSVFDVVEGLASEMVAKNGGEFTAPEAMTAMFEANPAAYDAYLQEGGR